MKRIKLTKCNLFLVVSFFILFLSYSINLWKIATYDNFYDFDAFSESLVYGKIVRSQSDGVFAYGGLPGCNYDKNKSDAGTAYQYQLEYLYKVKPMPPNYITYNSQTGGQGILYSFIFVISPFNVDVNFHIVKFINAFLIALIFTLFIGWVYRSFGLISSLITFLLLLFSPWLVSFGHSLWWSLWSFYLPFLTMLLLLEQKYSRQIQVSNKTIFIALFIAVFIKCIFTGFEFISTTLLALYCPVVYYFYLKRLSFASFFKFCFKAGIVAVLAVFAEMLILITQIKFLKGTFSDGIHHIIYSFLKRSSNMDASLTDVTSFDIVKNYMIGNAFEIGFLHTESMFYFIYLIIAICICAIIIYFLGKVSDQRKNKSLLLATFFSLLCPLSWYIIFKQHSVIHYHLDYIVWYIPFLLFGFLVIGQAMSCIVSRVKSMIAYKYKI